MHDTNTIRPLLDAILHVAGSKAEVCRRLRIDKKTLDNWLNAPAHAPVKIQPAHADRVSVAAHELGIEAELYQRIAPLWDFRRPYAANRECPTYEDVHLARPFVNFHVDVPALEIDLRSPFGVAPSVLTSTPDRIQKLMLAGNDWLVFKTVRSREHEPLPEPNMAVVGSLIEPIETLHGTLLTAQVRLPRDEDPPTEGSWVNSWGIPSDPVPVWTAHYRAATASARSGQAIVLSVVGSAREDEPVATLIEDFVRVAELAAEAGARIVELNLSCPNCQGREGEVYRDVELSVEICRRVRLATIGEAKLLVKLGYLPGPALREFVHRTHRSVDGYTVVNTLKVRALDERRTGYEPRPIFGSDRAMAGLSGTQLFALGIDSVQHLRVARDELGGPQKFAIVAVGGVNTEARVTDYLNAGADVVTAASVFFHDPLFGVRVQRHFERSLPQTRRTRADEEERAFFNLRLALERPSLRDVAGARRAGMEILMDWSDANTASLQSSYRRAELPSAEWFEQRILDDIGRRRAR